MKKRFKKNVALNSMFINNYFCFDFKTKEAKRLKEFLEDYDDDRDDPKYYR